MLYVSSYNSAKQTYGVTDTDDGVTQHMTKANLLQVVNKYKLRVKGVNGSSVTVVSNPMGYDKQSMQEWVAERRAEGTLADWVFDKFKPILLRYEGKDRKLVIPPVEVIGSGCFANNDELEEVIIPETVKSIGSDCFKDCSSLEKVVLPRSLQQVGKDAFLISDHLRSKMDKTYQVQVSTAQAGKFGDGWAYGRTVLERRDV